METDIRHVDVLVIGGGVVGCAILRELSRFDVRLALLERNPDICDGTSKSNSAIVHTGFDAPPGTLEARLLAQARDLWPQVIESLHIPYLQTGALMIATSAKELSTLESEIIPKAEQNGVTLQPLTREAVLDAAPYVSPAILGGVLVEGEGVFGGVLLGPTAEDVLFKTDFSTTAEGLRQIREGITKLVPVMAEAASVESVRQFAGLRAVECTWNICGWHGRVPLT